MTIIEVINKKECNALLYISCIEDCLNKLKTCIEHIESTEENTDEDTTITNRYE